MEVWVKIYYFGDYDGLVAKLCPTLVTPSPVASQAPLSMGFSSQEYWSGLTFPTPGDLPDPGIKPRSPTLWADSLLIVSSGKRLILEEMPLCNKSDKSG